MDGLLGQGLTTREARLQRLLAAVALGVGIVVAACFAVFDLLVTGYMPDVIAETAGVVVLSFALYRLMRGRRVGVAQHAVIAATTIMVLVSVNSGEPARGVLVWPLLVPPVAFLIIGPRWGWLYVLPTLAGVGAILAGRDGPVDPVLLANVGGAFTVLSLLSLWFAVAAQHATRALRRAAETDPETGLLNRASLREHYDSARADGAAGGRPCALLCLEVDGPRDEAAIAAIAHELRGAVPAGAALGRVGGATFAVFLPGHDMPEAVGLAEDLRRRLDRPAAPGVPPRTVSVGVSLDTSLDDGFAALVGRAEDRLFMAKMAGRNRIIADDRLVAE